MPLSTSPTRPFILRESTTSVYIYTRVCYIRVCGFQVQFRKLDAMYFLARANSKGDAKHNYKYRDEFFSFSLHAIICADEIAVYISIGRDLTSDYY